MPQNPPTRPRITMQFLRGRTLAPPFVRPRGHLVDQLGGLNALKFSLRLGGRIIAKDHLHSKPRSHNTTLIHGGLPEPRPSCFGAFLRGQPTEPEGLHMWTCGVVEGLHAVDGVADPRI